jgi:hypothetical protein
MTAKTDVILFGSLSPSRGSVFNEVVKDKDGIERPKLHRVIKNLITQATTAAAASD